MESYDAKKAARVWQRVQATQQPQQPPQPDMAGLPGLIAEEMQDAALYLQLSKRMGQKEAQILRRLAEEERSHAACLKGIYTLITGEQIAPRVAPSPNDSSERILRRCYGREMRCLAQYEARTADPEYGPVFARLAAQEREHCMAVLELLGRLREK